MARPASKSAPSQEEVLREFPPVGKYRVRLLQTNKSRVLDVREYVSSDTFEGFTRRGIRLSNRAELDLLRDILKEILDDPKSI